MIKNEPAVWKSAIVFSLLLGLASLPLPALAQSSEQMCIARAETRAVQLKQINQQEFYTCVGLATGVAMTTIATCAARANGDLRSFAACAGITLMSQIVAAGACLASEFTKNRRVDVDLQRDIDSCRGLPLSLDSYQMSLASDE